MDTENPSPKKYKFIYDKPSCLEQMYYHYNDAANYSQGLGNAGCRHGFSNTYDCQVCSSQLRCAQAARDKFLQNRAQPMLEGHKCICGSCGDRFDARSSPDRLHCPKCSTAAPYATPEPFFTYLPPTRNWHQVCRRCGNTFPATTPLTTDCPDCIRKNLLRQEPTPPSSMPCKFCKAAIDSAPGNSIVAVCGKCLAMGLGKPDEPDPAPCEHEWRFDPYVFLGLGGPKMWECKHCLAQCWFRPKKLKPATPGEIYTDRKTFKMINDFCNLPGQLACFHRFGLRRKCKACGMHKKDWKRIIRYYVDKDFVVDHGRQKPYCILPVSKIEFSPEPMTKYTDAERLAVDRRFNRRARRQRRRAIAWSLLTTPFRLLRWIVRGPVAWVRYKRKLRAFDRAMRAEDHFRMLGGGE